jgi:hypothetical protein
MVLVDLLQKENLRGRQGIDEEYLIGTDDEYSEEIDCTS